MDEFAELTRRAKELFRAKKYFIAPHATDDYPERNITAVDIIEVIKIGSVVGRGNLGEGRSRYVWVGEDASDRVLRLIVVIENNLIVVSAAQANSTQEEDYRDEDSSSKKEE